MYTSVLFLFTLHEHQVSISFSIKTTIRSTKWLIVKCYINVRSVSDVVAFFHFVLFIFKTCLLITFDVISFESSEPWDLEIFRHCGIEARKVIDKLMSAEAFENAMENFHPFIIKVFRLRPMNDVNFEGQPINIDYRNFKNDCICCGVFLFVRNAMFWSVIFIAIELLVFQKKKKRKNARLNLDKIKEIIIND